MDELLKDLLASIGGREAPRWGIGGREAPRWGIGGREAPRWGIRRAKDYLATFGPTAPPGVDDPLLWPQHLTASESKLVYANEDMTVLDAKAAGLALEKTEGSLLDFACVLTATTKDRDGDILESAGAELDPQMPLLWQHLPTQPIGKMVKKLSQDARDVRVHFAIANTALGRDAATLAEFGALRLSHGFRPIEAEPIKNASHGWHIKRFATFEGSLVSIPSNVSGVITAFSREKLHTPLVKSWAKAIADARLASVTVPAEMDSIKAGRVLSKCNHKKIKSAHQMLSEVIDSNSHHEMDDDEDEEMTEKAAKPGAAMCKCDCASCKKCSGMMPKAMQPAAPAQPLANAFPAGTKAYVPIEGSWDWIRSKLQPTLSTYLTGKLLLGRNDYAWIDSMFPDSALVCVDSYPKSACYRLGWKLTDGVPAWDGEPVAVEVVARLEEIKNHVAAVAQRRVDAMTAKEAGEQLYKRLAGGEAVGGAQASLLLTALSKAVESSRQRDEQAALQALLT